MEGDSKVSEVSAVTSGGPNLNLLQQTQYYNDNKKAVQEDNFENETAQVKEAEEIAQAPSQLGADSPKPAAVSALTATDETPENVQLSQTLSLHLSQTAEAAHSAQTDRDEAQALASRATETAQSAQSGEVAQAATAALVGESAAGIGALPVTSQELGVPNDALTFVNDPKPVFETKASDFTNIKYGNQDGVFV